MPVPPARGPQHLSPQDVVRSGLCVGCGSCVGQAPAEGPLPRMALDRYGQLKPAGPAAWLRTRSARFARTCPFSPAAADEDELAAERFPAARHRDPAVGRYEAAYVGAVAEGDFRARGSSGGMVTWMLAELLRTGLVDAVAHVAEAGDLEAEPQDQPPGDPQDERRFFRFRVSRSEAEVRAGAKSRYYPVELSEVLRTIRAVPGRYAVVGIPCFVKAVHLLRREDPLIRERVVFTLGLFCGHMKSARFVESFAWQLGVPLSDVQRVEYRLKDASRPANWYTAQLTRADGTAVKRDWWHLADGDWGAGYFQNGACNFCDDVVAETADVSFGDAWVEPYASDGRGTNVVLVRAPALAATVAAAIRDGRLRLAPVDGAFVARTQAAGLRQRREGLAYRLSWGSRRGVRPRKRVAPDARAPSARRKLVYRMRALISAWSHRVFWLARATRRPGVYLWWARAALTVYHALAYARGPLGALLQRAGLR
jgi:coenzyme F420-reducing hydrogenase beta subunit